MKRIRMIQAGEEVPQDILSCMLSSKVILFCGWHLSTLFSIGNMENLKIEDLVDDFCTFYVAGNDYWASKASPNISYIETLVLCRYMSRIWCANKVLVQK